VQIVNGVKIEKNFPMQGGIYEGVVVGSSHTQTTIHHDGSERKVYKVRYPADNTEEELEEEEIRPLIMMADLQVCTRPHDLTVLREWQLIGCAPALRCCWICRCARR
jgi:hypothetical protein